MLNLFPILMTGFLLGLEHAFEADHMVAVSTMVLQHKNPWRAALVGTFWGMGHTVTLFIVGIIVLLFKVAIPQNMALWFEFFVGVMLTFLGIRLIILTRKTLHIHAHTHGGSEHDHPHYHAALPHQHKHHKSFFIGTVHGLAGSGALVILVLSTIRSVIDGLLYILIFGIGSIAGMSLMSVFIGIPFIYTSRKFPMVEKYLKVVAGILSIGIGLLIVYRIGVGEGLLR